MNREFWCSDCDVRKLYESTNQTNPDLVDDFPQAAGAVSGLAAAVASRNPNIGLGELRIRAARLGLAYDGSKVGEVLDKLHPDLVNAVYDCDIVRPRLGTCALASAKSILR